MKLTITLIVDTEKEANALKIVSKLNEIISAGESKIEKYHKGGFKALLSKEILEKDWSTACLNAISIAQSFGRSWSLLGNIEEELSLVGNEFSISGIEWAELHLNHG